MRRENIPRKYAHFPFSFQHGINILQTTHFCVVAKAKPEELNIACTITRPSWLGKKSGSQD